MSCNQTAKSGESLLELNQVRFLTPTGCGLQRKWICPFAVGPGCRHQSWLSLGFPIERRRTIAAYARAQSALLVHVFKMGVGTKYWEGFQVGWIWVIWLFFLSFLSFLSFFFIISLLFFIPFGEEKRNSCPAEWIDAYGGVDWVGRHPPSIQERWRCMSDGAHVDHRSFRIDREEWKSTNRETEQTSGVGKKDTIGEINRTVLNVNFNFANRHLKTNPESPWSMVNNLGMD